MTSRLTWPRPVRTIWLATTSTMATKTSPTTIGTMSRTPPMPRIWPPPRKCIASCSPISACPSRCCARSRMGYRHPTPIQEQAIPVVLMTRDVLGVAQTGTGKTAGFTLPMLDILAGSRARGWMQRSLILEPTRELALQVAENFVQYGKYLKLTHALIIGGESMSDQRTRRTAVSTC